MDTTRLKRIAVIAATALAAVAAITVAVVAQPAVSRAAAATPDPTATPVLVELFTSETCDMCVAGDSVLAFLDSAQPVEGARVIAMAWHVSLNASDARAWTDPFATTFSDTRHRAYAASLGRTTLYTPQALIDGTTDIPGYNAIRIRRMITRAIGQPKPLAVTVTASLAGSDSLAFTMLIRPQGTPAAGATPPGTSEFMIALVEDGLVKRVTAGENAGKTLKHERVVRQIVKAGELDARDLNAAKMITAKIAIPRGVDRARLGAVAVVQETVTRRVLGVASSSVR